MVLEKAINLVDSVGRDDQKNDKYHRGQDHWSGGAHKSA